MVTKQQRKQELSWELLLRLPHLHTNQRKYKKDKSFVSIINLITLTK